MKSPLPEAVKKSVLLNGLSEEMRDNLLKDSVRRSYSEGETIFVQGDAARAVFIVLSGFVKLSRLTPSGTEAVVTIMGRNRSFAEAMVLRGEPYPVTAEAISDCTLLQIDGVRLRQFLLENQEFAIRMLASTFVHLQGLVDQIERLKAHTGVQRVAQFLADLTDLENGACEVSLPYNKRLIAGHLGMQPESLSRAFARLREHGVRVDANKAEIDDIAALRLLALD
jgi:CRP-like cAMP-binding protein